MTTTIEKFSRLLLTLLIIGCFLACECMGQSHAWTQQDGNAKRNRFTRPSSDIEMKSNGASNHQSEMLPSSIILDPTSLRIFGVAVDYQKHESVVCIESNMKSCKVNVDMPKETKLITIPPVMDSSSGYYTIRRNTSDETRIVMKSVIDGSTGSNQVLFRTKAEIFGMIYTEYGLILVITDLLVNIDSNTGKIKWSTGGATSNYGTQMLYSEYPTPTIYTSTIGDNYLALIAIEYAGYSKSYSALRYDINKDSKGTVTLHTGYDINTKYLSGAQPKVCSNRIAAYKDVRFYGMACDVGFIGFHQDNVKNISISIKPETQVFGTRESFIAVTTGNGKTDSQVLRFFSI